MKSVQSTASSTGAGSSDSDLSSPAAAATVPPTLVRARTFGFFLVITGAIAWVASWVLVMERLALLRDANYVASCDINPWVSCSSVMKSEQAALFGFPNPLIGVVAFAVVITTGMVLLAGGTLARWYWIGLQIGVTLGMVMIGWLWYQSLYEIGALCPYCMVVWAMMAPLFVWVTVRNAHHGALPLGAGPTRVLSEWAWIIVALAFVGVITSILFRFYIGNMG